MTAPYAHMIRDFNRELNTELITELRAETSQLHAEIDRLTSILLEHGICPDCTHRDE